MSVADTLPVGPAHPYDERRLLILLSPPDDDPDPWAGYATLVEFRNAHDGLARGRASGATSIVFARLLRAHAPLSQIVGRALSQRSWASERRSC